MVGSNLGEVGLMGGSVVSRTSQQTLLQQSVWDSGEGDS